MLITRLKLQGYKRLMLNNINFFDYVPTSPYQLILGTNGSGKSSVLYELTPLPAQAADYVKDGYKEIHLEHNGNTFVLTSTFKSGNKHSFLKEGVECNSGGTLTVQRELVRREFGIWDELHDLLRGTLKFTNMSTAKRREWITSLSKVDYKYALQVFERVRSRGRDAQGALKNDRKRLGEATQNLDALGDLAQVEVMCGQWRDELNALLISKPAQIRAAHVVDEVFNQLVATTEKVCAELLRNIPQSPSNDYRDLSDVQVHLARVTQEISSVQTLLGHYGSEYSELEEITVALEGETLDVHALEMKFADYQAQVGIKRAAIRHFPNIADADSILIDLQTALPALIDIFQELPDNSERVFSKDKIDTAKVDLAAAEHEVDVCNNRLAQIEHKLIHMQEAKESECPSCGYVWRPGYSDDEYAGLITIQGEFSTKLIAAKKVVCAKEEYLEQSEQYMQLFNRFKYLTQSYPRMRPLWDAILEHSKHLNHPRSHITYLHEFAADVLLHADITRMEKDSGHLIELLERDKVRRGEGSVRFEERLAKLKDSIERTTGRLQELNVEQNAAKTFQTQVKRWDEKYQSVASAWNTYPQLYQERVEVLRNDCLDSVIQRHQNSLAIAEQKLTKRTTLLGIVADLEKSHEQLRSDVEAYRALIKALSPTEGLIADLQIGSIACITAQMNSVIQAIWTYDMQILPCNMDDGELDYKFPLQIHTAGNGPKDVSEASIGQMEMIDFAFKTTVMLYLGLREYPLYLDELGANFDDQHRINVMNFVKRLVDTGYHRQVFMISHYASSHGAFTNAEILVMDERNISVPKEHNTHVTMA